jgi:hypothetical protein
MAEFSHVPSHQSDEVRHVVAQTRCNPRMTIHKSRQCCHFAVSRLVLLVLANSLRGPLLQKCRWGSVFA